MIIDQLKNAALYFGTHTRMEEALRYLQKTDFSKIEPGKYEIDGANVFVLIQQYDTKAKEKGRWEAHRKYIDVQYVHSGTELFGYAHLGQLQSVVYDEPKDFHELKGTGDFLRVPAGMFLVLFPHDAHMPGISVSIPHPVKKVVVKVLAGK